MAYIFLDESGDLGFDFKKKKTSNHFVISCLFVADSNKRAVEKIIKKIFSGFSKAELKSHSGTLHSFKESPTIRHKLLKMLANKNVYIISIYLNKHKVYTRLQDEKHILYNYVANILLDRICTKNLILSNEKINLISSKRETNKFLNDNFCSYLKCQTHNNHQLIIDVSIKSPREEKCLQIVDCISWSTFRKIEHKDDSYISLIKDKIIEEDSLFS